MCTSGNVTGSIAVRVIANLHSLNHAGRIMALGSTLPVRRVEDLITLMFQFFRNSGILNLLGPQGPVQACDGIALHLRISRLMNIQ
jgi:hypothetical protein